VAAGNIAVGDETASGLATAVHRRWPGTALRRLTESADLDAELAAAADRPLWVLVRDPHRHHWMGELVAAIVGRRPDVVVIDTGWPGWSPPEPAVHVVTHGASWASGEAVVRLLAP
jgi:beta-N-acetylhexosaminidase